MILKNLFLKAKAFSLIELLVTLSIIATLSLIGVKSYRNQIEKARTAEAQQILSFIYSAERNFYNAWDTYHEHLMAVGAIPSGVYNYDAGFTGSGSDTDGELEDYPLREILSLSECIDFNNICNDDCLDAVTSQTTSAKKDAKYASYFGKAAVCDVLSDTTLDKSSVKGGADEKGFKAFAITRFGGKDDIWSIDEQQNLVHETP